MPKPKSLTVKDLYEQCSDDKKIIISDYYCVPMNWVSPATGQVSGPFFIAKLQKDVFVELSMSGQITGSPMANADGYVPAWATTKADQIKVLKGLIDQLMRLV